MSNGIAACDSSAFKVTNCVRQGGILSPKLFIVYMDDLSDQLNNSNIGGNFGSGQLVNHISYADDMCPFKLFLQLVCRNY